MLVTDHCLRCSEVASNRRTVTCTACCQHAMLLTKYLESTLPAPAHVSISAVALQEPQCPCDCCLQGPADQAVEEVHAILRAIVNMVLNSEECVALQRYIVLKREIMTTAAASLDGMRDDARKMVANMVEMERSYLTAEVFREILASSHAVDELSEEVHVRTASLHCLVIAASCPHCIHLWKNMTFCVCRDT